MDKLVSIVLPTYNGQKYIKDAIDSVLAQSYQNWELIIVNDCSQDNTLKIINEYAQKDSRIKIINNDVNKKLPASLNIGFEAAKGEYYTWTSDDNMYKPDALKYMANFLDNNPQTDLISCNYDLINEDNTKTTLKAITPTRNVLNNLFSCNVGACFMYRKEIAQKTGQYDENMFCAEDYDYWCRLALVGKISYSDENLYIYRYTPTSLTSTRQNEIKKKTIEIQEKYALKTLEQLQYSQKDSTKILIKLFKNTNCSSFVKQSLKINKLYTIKYLSKTIITILAQKIFSIKNVNNKKVLRIFGLKITYNTKCNFKDRLIIWGWWQGKNLGDQWIKSCMQRLFPNAVFVYTTEKRINKAGFIICGGGGLWHDDIHKVFKQKIKKPFGVIGLGAEFEFPDKKANKLKDKAKFFYVRDQYSLSCMHINDVQPSVDITFSYPLKWMEQNELNTNNLFFVWRDGKIFKEYNLEKFINYGHYKNNLNDFEKIISANFNKIIYDDFQVYADNIEKRIENCGFVISGRYHGIIAAIHKGIPCIAIDICPKIRALMNDCGLNEYCIKMDEADKLDSLIKKAKENTEKIRQKQYEYRKNAIETITQNIKFAKKEVNKYIKPFSHLKGIHYGAYWMGLNDVVNVMSDDMSDLCNLIKIDLKLYSKKKDKRIKKSIKTDNGQINYIDTKKLIKDIKNFKPDFIILNSGGITLEQDGFDYCKNNNIKLIGISLSDPDVYPYNGAIYADKFDIYYTNSRYSLENQYDKNKVNIKLLPFAASTKHHYFMPEIERKYDIVVIGHAREDRKKIIKNLSALNYKIGLYGNGWENGQGCVNGINHTKAINSGKIYLSFAKTVAGYNNVKVGLFEALACNTCVVTQHMDELNNYLKIGEEIVCYNSEEDLIVKIKYYLENDVEREKVQKASYERFLKEHTYQHRAIKILKDIEKIKGE